jgi:hypothetical protein
MLFLDKRKTPAHLSPLEDSMLRSLALFFLLGSLTISGYSAQKPPMPSQQTGTPAAAPAPAAAANESPAAQKEDWTKLPVDRAVLKPILTGVSLGKADTPDFTREIIRLEWRQGDPIDIYVVTPHAVKKPRVVLYLYSYPSDVDRFMSDGWCRHVTSKGLAAVGFVSALTGVRYRYRAPRDWFISELQESLGSTVHDVQLIIDYLATRGDLSVDKVGMWGEGSGASIAILAAAADPRIAAVDALNPWGDWPDWLKLSPVIPDEQRARYLTPEFLEKVSTLDPIGWLPQLQDRAFRVQQIMDNPDDQDTPPAVRDKIAAAVPHDRLVQYKDVAAHREAWKATGTSGWIAAQLLPLPEPAAQSAASQPR